MILTKGARRFAMAWNVDEADWIRRGRVYSWEVSGNKSKSLNSLTVKSYWLEAFIPFGGTFGQMSIGMAALRPDPVPGFSMDILDEPEAGAAGLSVPSLTGRESLTVGVPFDLAEKIANRTLDWLISKDLNVRVRAFGLGYNPQVTSPKFADLMSRIALHALELPDLPTQEICLTHMAPLIGGGYEVSDRYDANNCRAPYSG